MVGTRTMRSWWDDYRCGPDSLVRPITMFGRSAGEVASVAYDGFIAQEKTLIATGYTGVRSVWIPRNCPTGIGGATCQPDGDNCSLHNYRIADDIDPFGYGNPHFQRRFGDRWDFDDCKIQRHQVEAVERIKNTNGEQYFRWLGWAIGDTMHFELQVPPSRTEVNWNTVPGGIGAQMFVSKGDKGPMVAYWQIILKYDLGANLGNFGDGSFGTAAGDGVDGDYGSTMEAAVKAHTNRPGNVIGPYEARELQVRAWGREATTSGLTKAQADSLYAAKGHPHTGKVTIT